jgi:hypothetical protein
MSPALTLSPTFTLTEVTRPIDVKDKLASLSGTMTAEAETESPLLVCEFDTEPLFSSDTVGMAVGAADEPQAAKVNAKILINIQKTFFILCSPKPV